MIRRLLVIGLITLAAAAPAGAFKQHSFIDETASALSGRKVTIRCLNAKESKEDFVINDGAAAYVEGVIDQDGKWWPEDYATFAWGICKGLMRLHKWDAGAETVPDLSFYILVLVHESGHLKGEVWGQNEALTQRWALKQIKRVSMEYFGLSPEAAILVLRYAVYWHLRLPITYKAPGCVAPFVDAKGNLQGCK